MDYCMRTMSIMITGVGSTSNTKVGQKRVTVIEGTTHALHGSLASMVWDNMTASKQPYIIHHSESSSTLNQRMRVKSLFIHMYKD